MRVAIWALIILVALLGGYLLYLNLWPEGYGTLVVISDPPGAQVWVDLAPTALTTNGALRLSAGSEHSIIVKMDTLEGDPTAQTVKVQSGRRDTIYFRLLPPHPVVPGSTPKAIAAPMTPPPEHLAQSVDTVRHTSYLDIQKPISEAEESSRRSQTSAFPEPAGLTGVIEIGTSVSGALIFVNGMEQPDHTPESLTLPLGTYTIRVALEGYTFEPTEQTVRLTRDSLYKQITFSAKAASSTSRGLVIETSPIDGPVFVDSVLVGTGKVSTTHDFGTHVVSFGPVEGWQVPATVRVTITPSQLRPEVKGLYTRILALSAEAVANDNATARGDIRWDTGIYFEDSGPQRGSTQGSKIKRIPGAGKFGWELGPGDAARNPTGGDYVEFVFTLPPETNAKSDHKLQLYLYRSARNYPLVLSSGKSEVVISINGRTFLDGYRPQNATSAADGERYEEWSMLGYLKAGENRIMVRAGDENTVFNYLWKVDIH
jgi:hypothetical protein